MKDYSEYIKTIVIEKKTAKKEEVEIDIKTPIEGKSEESITNPEFHLFNNQKENESTQYALGALVDYYPRGSYAQLADPLHNDLSVSDNMDNGKNRMRYDLQLEDVKKPKKSKNDILDKGPQDAFDDVDSGKWEAPKPEESKTGSDIQDLNNPEQPSRAGKERKKEANGKHEYLDADGNTIGKVYVLSPDYDTDNNTAFSIPFQSNPIIGDMSRNASYNSIKFFGRIGEIKQYTDTSSLEQISLETTYFVENDDTWSATKLQEIELKYRSLVLPRTQTSKVGESEATWFTRPPVVNIVIGQDNNNTLAQPEKGKTFNNFLTEIDQSGKLYFKNFVVTKVTITKDQDKWNYNIEDQGTIHDMMGFTVRLELLEIDDDYIGTMPTFDAYKLVIGTLGGTK